MLLVVMVSMQLNGDSKALLTKRTDNLRLLIPLVAIVSLSLLFSQDNNIPLLAYALSGKGLWARRRWATRFSVLY